ncbi:MAG: hypothetical protein IPH08_04040 [Rhodocyclaceae bacterium]|nr:hypothetical protein [Rhodocyclaceae bacterium]
MKPLWATDLLADIGGDDPGPPTQRWWVDLDRLWRKAVVIDFETARLVAALIDELATEVGDREMAAISSAFSKNKRQEARRTLEMTFALMRRSNAVKRLGRKV